MTIRVRVVGVVVIAIVSLLSLVGGGWWGMSGMNRNTVNLVQQQLLPLVDQDVAALADLQASIELLLNADRDGYQAMLEEKAAAAATTPDALAAAEAIHAENLAQVGERMARARPSFNDEMAALHQAFLDLYQQWQTQSNQVIALAKAGDHAAARALSYGDSRASFDAMRHQVDLLQNQQEQRIAATMALIQDKVAAAQAAADEVAAMTRRTMMVFIAIAAGSGLLLAVLGTVMVRSVTGAIRAMVDRLRDIAEGEGDLTQRVDETRRDELGELGRWFNLFVKKTQDVMIQVAGNTQEVAAASTQIAASNEEMAAGMSEQTSQLAQISSAIEEMSASVVEVAKKSAEAADASTESGRTAEQGGRAVQQTVGDMHDISEAVGATAVAVEELGKRSEQIGQIIAVINDIADQTNLLALNAAIEAARAGEHGRGFAVVADEVRKLADRTTSATDEIAQSIKAIQAETQTAVGRMTAGTEQVEAGVKRAIGAGESLQAIVLGAQSVEQMVRSIAAAAEQQSAASEQVSRNVESIAAVARQAEAGTEQAAQAASQLSTQAERLQHLVNQFKLS